uniref:Uncharacterized protein n=1 Tax=Arundo donax TaxID=35708 RepID=A0A0A9FF79_ARUDO
MANDLAYIERRLRLDGCPGPWVLAVTRRRVAKVLSEVFQEQEELAADGGEEGNDVVRAAGRPRADGDTQCVGVEGRDGRAGFFGLHGEDPGAVGDEVPRPHVRGFDAGDRRLCEPLRRQVSVGVGVEVVDIQLVNAVAHIPVVQEQVEMLLPLLRQPLGGAVVALGRALALGHTLSPHLPWLVCLSPLVYGGAPHG